MTPVAVLASGNGTNFQALIDFTRQKKSCNYRIARLITNKPNALAIARAKKNNIPYSIVDHREFSSRKSFDKAVLKELKRSEAQWVTLAGFMRIITPTLINTFQNRILNIHPSLLPSFPGLHAAKQALDAKVKVTGCTIHYVDKGMDTGPIVHQHPINILKNDTEDSLTKRIQTIEHKIYPLILNQLVISKDSQ